MRGFEEIRLATGKGLLFVASTEGAARIYADRGELEKGFGYLEPIRKHLTPETLPLFHRLAYKTGHFELAVNLGKECYQLMPTYEVAFVNALAHAALREAEPTIGWLKCAVREGMPNLPMAVSGKEFDPVREDPSFDGFVKGFS